MSERGLLLALQRLHDDPGFMNLIAQDPDGTLGLYDLDDQERQALAQAIQNDDDQAILDMAQRCGIDWTADHIGGIGALHESEVSTEAAPKLGVHGANAMTGSGYDSTSIQRPRTGG
ncbi:MAG: hypothetical protein WCD37_20550 [Chloroflexia bacterium]